MIGLHDISVGQDAVLGCAYLSVLAKNVVVQDLRQHSVSVENLENVGQFLLLNERRSNSVDFSLLRCSSTLSSLSVALSDMSVAS